ncbi:MAG: alpha/beta hydrolase [Clostridia bacterium]|nr:alpha/beta hydrolase [Clostridia bacterium]
MIKKWKITVPPLTGKAQRYAYVYCPDQPGRYPVLYMFDGHNVFFDEDATYGKSWGMKEYLEQNQIPLIVAAVECNHQGNERLSEYSPFTFTNAKLGHIEGKGEQTMEWLVKTFKPMIDQRFPTLRGRENTWIAGSSMGGLMSLYAVLQYNDTFSKAACLSPSVWFAAGQLDELIKNARLHPGTVVYMDYGSREMKHHQNMGVRFRKVASALLEKGVWLDCRIVPEGNHCEASWEKQIPFFMNTLLY